MKKNPKILKTLFALSAMTTIAIAPTVLETINTEKPIAAEDGSPSANSAVTAAPKIVGVSMLNHATNPAISLASIKFTLTSSGGTTAPTFYTVQPLRFMIHRSGGISQSWNVDISTYKSYVTETYPQQNEVVDFTTTYEIVIRLDNVTYKINSTVNLAMASITAVGDVWAQSANVEIGAIPVGNPENLEPEMNSIGLSESQTDIEIDFNLNPTSAVTGGWDMGDSYSTNIREGIRVHRKISGDPDTAYTQVTSYTQTGGVTSPGSDVPTTSTIVSIPMGDDYDVGQDYDFRVNYLLTVDHNDYSSRTSKIADVWGSLYSPSILIPRTTIPASPTITNATVDADNTALTFTLDLNTPREPARLLDGTSSAIQLYTYDGTSYTLVTPAALTATTGVLPVSNGDAFEDSYSFTLDITALSDSDFNADDILESLTVGVGYLGDTTSTGFEFSAVIGSIPRDPAPSTVTSPIITSDITNSELEFTLSDSTSRGWEIGTGGVKIFSTPSNTGTQVEITNATFDTNLSVGRAVPQTLITANIPTTNFPDIEDDNISYDVVVVSNYEVASSSDDALVGPITATSDVVNPRLSNEILNLSSSAGTSGGEIDLTWNDNYDIGVNTVNYFAVRDVLNPTAGWKIYSSDQAGIIMTSDTTATISDASFINQGSQYDISMMIDLDTTIDDDLAFYGTPWTGWDGLVSSAPVATIGVSSFTTSYAAPTTAPDAMAFTFVSSTKNSLLYNFTYNNGSLTNPTITAIVNSRSVLASDININFINSTTGTIEILQLDPETNYEVEFTYDYLFEPATSVNVGTDTTLATPFIAVTTILDTTLETLTVTIGGDETLIDDSTVNSGGSANLELIFDDAVPTTLTLSDIPTSDALVGTHVFDISGVTGYTSITLNIIVNEIGATTPLGLDNLIIDDKANSDVGIITSYSINNIPAQDAIASDPTSVTPVTGTDVGDLNVNWLIDYPPGITLSDIEFTFEVSIVDPTDELFIPGDWTDVSSQTSINADMKSGVISDLTDPSYNAGVWVRITIDYINIAEDLAPLDSTESAIPQQVTTSALSTGALIGVIVGSIAGVALIALGGWFFYKKQNPSVPKGGKGQGSKKSVDTKKKAEVKKPSNTKKATTSKTNTQPTAKTPKKKSKLFSFGSKPKTPMTKSDVKSVDKPKVDPIPKSTAKPTISKSSTIKPETVTTSSTMTPKKKSKLFSFGSKPKTPVTKSVVKSVDKPKVDPITKSTAKPTISKPSTIKPSTIKPETVTTSSTMTPKKKSKLFSFGSKPKPPVTKSVVKSVDKPKVDPIPKSTAKPTISKPSTIKSETVTTSSTMTPKKKSKLFSFGSKPKTPMTKSDVKSVDKPKVDPIPKSTVKPTISKPSTIKPETVTTSSTMTPKKKSKLFSFGSKPKPPVTKSVVKSVDKPKVDPITKSTVKPAISKPSTIKSEVKSFDKPKSTPTSSKPKTPITPVTKTPKKKTKFFSFGSKPKPPVTKSVKSVDKPKVDPITKSTVKPTISKPSTIKSEVKSFDKPKPTPTSSKPKTPITPVIKTPKKKTKFFSFGSKPKPPVTKSVKSVDKPKVDPITKSTVKPTISKPSTIKSEVKSFDKPKSTPISSKPKTPITPVIKTPKKKTKFFSFGSKPKPPVTKSVKSVDKPKFDPLAKPIVPQTMPKPPVVKKDVQTIDKPKPTPTVKPKTPITSPTKSPKKKSKLFSFGGKPKTPVTKSVKIVDKSKVDPITRPTVKPTTTTKKVTPKKSIKVTQKPTKKVSKPKVKKTVTKKTKTEVVKATSKPIKKVVTKKSIKVTPKPTKKVSKPKVSKPKVKKTVTKKTKTEVVKATPKPTKKVVTKKSIKVTPKPTKKVSKPKVKKPVTKTTTKKSPAKKIVVKKPVVQTTKPPKQNMGTIVSTPITGPSVVKKPTKPTVAKKKTGAITHSSNQTGRDSKKHIIKQPNKQK